MVCDVVCDVMYCDVAFDHVEKCAVWKHILLHVIAYYCDVCCRLLEVPSTMYNDAGHSGITSPMKSPMTITRDRR